MKIDPLPPGYERSRHGVEGEVYRLSNGALLAFDELSYLLDDPRYAEISDGRAELIGLDGSPEGIAAWNSRSDRLLAWELAQVRLRLAHHKISPAEREQLLQEERELRRQVGTGR
jgi:hypothetical protein